MSSVVSSGSSLARFERGLVIVGAGIGFLLVLFGTLSVLSSSEDRDPSMRVEGPLTTTTTEGEASLKNETEGTASPTISTSSTTDSGGEKEIGPGPTLREKFKSFLHSTAAAAEGVGIQGWEAPDALHIPLTLLPPSHQQKEKEEEAINVDPATGSSSSNTTTTTTRSASSVLIERSGTVPGSVFAAGMGTGSSLRVAVVTVFEAEDDSPIEYSWMLPLSFHNKREYCRRHRYDFLVARREDHPRERSPSWTKFYMMRKWLREYDVMLWVDPVSLITRLDRRLEDLLRPGYDVQATKNFEGNLVLGTLLVRKSKWVIDMVDVVLASSEGSDATAFANVLEERAEFRQRHFTPPQRWLNAYASEMAEGRPSSAWRWGDFLINFPSCRALSTACASTFDRVHERIQKAYGLTKATRESNNDDQERKPWAYHRNPPDPKVT